MVFAAIKKWKQRQPLGRGAAPRRRVRLQIERLDDRCLPAITVYNSVDVPKPIPDGNTITSTLPISDNYAIGDIDVTLNISHTWDADLRVFLIAPDGTRVELYTGVGGSGDNFDYTILDDEAATPITSGTAPFNGKFRPEGSLRSLYGRNVTGLWTLEVRDVIGPAPGILNSWSLAVNDDLSPDLLGQSFAIGQSSAQWGGPVTVSYAIGNSSVTPAGPFAVQFFLSPTATMAGSALPLGSVTVGNLAAGGQASGTVTLTLPGAPGSPPAGFTDPDAAFIGLLIDPSNAVAERDELNNSNRGTGLDRDSLTVGTVNVAGLPFLIVDLNGDGWPDAMVADELQDEVVSFERVPGQAELLPGPFQHSAGLGSPRDLALADLNRDGLPDMIVADSGNGMIRVLLGMPPSGGQMSFDPVYYAFPAGSGPARLAVVDLNGDGYLDLAVANEGSNNVSIFFGLGDGTFFTGPQVPAGGPAPKGLLLRDLVGPLGNQPDGQLDLVILHQNGVSVIPGNGTGFNAALMQSVPMPLSPIGLIKGPGPIRFYTARGVHQLGPGLTVSTLFTLPAGWSATVMDVATILGKEFYAVATGPSVTVFIRDGSGVFPLPIVSNIGPIGDVELVNPRYLYFSYRGSVHVQVVDLLGTLGAQVNALGGNLVFTSGGFSIVFPGTQPPPSIGPPFPPGVTPPGPGGTGDFTPDSDVFAAGLVLGFGSRDGNALPLLVNAVIVGVGPANVPLALPPRPRAADDGGGGGFGELPAEPPEEAEQALSRALTKFIADFENMYRRVREAVGGREDAGALPPPMDLEMEEDEEQFLDPAAALSRLGDAVALVPQFGRQSAHWLFKSVLKEILESLPSEPILPAAGPTSSLSSDRADESRAWSAAVPLTALLGCWIAAADQRPRRNTPVLHWGR